MSACGKRNSESTSCHPCVGSLKEVTRRLISHIFLEEAHLAPERAISDAAQSLDLNQFAKMMEALKSYIALWKETRKEKIVATVAR